MCLFCWCIVVMVNALLLISPQPLLVVVTISFWILAFQQPLWISGNSCRGHSARLAGGYMNGVGDKKTNIMKPYNLWNSSHFLQLVEYKEAEVEYYKVIWTVPIQLLYIQCNYITISLHSWVIPDILVHSRVIPGSFPTF